TRCLSDWSSDVCSSDLVQSMCFGDAMYTATQLESGIHMVCSACTVCLDLGSAPKAITFDGARGQPITRAAALPMLDAPAIETAEIGRASCRERVESGVG